MHSRRNFLKITAGIAFFVTGGFIFSRYNSQKVKHILPSVSHERLALTVSLAKQTSNLQLVLDDRIIVKGIRVDSKGTNWQFISDKLLSNRSYKLQLLSEGHPIYKPWNLKTFPDPEADIDSVSIMAFTCAGGPERLKISGKEVFKPLSFRQKVFEQGLTKKPDFAIAIGDHVYWDLRGKDSPQVGRNSKLIKFFLGSYIGFFYGFFNRSEEASSLHNEKVLKNIGNEQIASLYGTRFKSTPIFFIPDDHDYFENDDAEDDLVTFPADKFSKGAFDQIANLFYPPLLDTPDGLPGRKIGRIRYGKVFEGLIADCAGDMSLGNKQAVLIAKQNEEWILSRIKHSKAKHVAFIPSHPLGYTAGKWREWYPDVVAAEGVAGTVANGLLAETKGSLTTRVNKYLWQEGWFLQHQRLIKSISDREGSRFIFSGDIHAIGAASIIQSGKLKLNNEVKTFLVGSVGSSSAGWPSFARGIVAEYPSYLVCKSIYKTREENGFTFFNINNKPSAELISCGGHDAEDGDTGEIVKNDTVLL